MRAEFERVVKRVRGVWRCLRLVRVGVKLKRSWENEGRRRRGKDKKVCCKTHFGKKQGKCYLSVAIMILKR